MVFERSKPYPTPKRILVVCTRRIGDVVLATPAVRSFKQEWPDAAIDVLVFEGTEGALENNPDIVAVIAVKRRASRRERLREARALWRKYDISYAVTPSDRAHLYGWLAGRYRVAIINGGPKHWLKHLMFNRWEAMPELPAEHTLNIGLAGARMLDIKPVYEVVPPAADAFLPASLSNDPNLMALRNQRFAVLQIDAMYQYKLWNPAGWTELIAWLRRQGYAVVLSGGSQAMQSAEVAAIVETAGSEAINLMGRLSLAELTTLIRQAALYVGPDTGVSHMAAATGIPTVVIFGPSNPIRWGPWPASWKQAASPWELRGSNRIGNVFLVQGPGACVPCLEEGCERHRQSPSACLTTLDGYTVISAAATMLGIPDGLATRPTVVIPTEPELQIVSFQRLGGHAHQG
jgi:heptosyltransferase-3